MKKKKFIAVLLLLALAAGCTVSAEAVSLGTGIEVVAGEVEMIKSGIVGERLTFTDGDFKSALCITNFGSVTFTALPPESEGVLLAAGKAVRVGQTVKRRNIGSLVFVPLAEEVEESYFEFKVNGAGAEMTARCTVKFVKKGNSAPTVPSDSAASVSITAQSGIGVHGRLEGQDPEGDELEFIVVAFPTNGSVRVKNRVTGEYEYTPRSGYTGADSFAYVVRDEYGNYSEPRRVRVSVTERLSEVVFCDMVGRREYGAAVAMSAIGVMSGESHGSAVYFKPDERVTRAEFVAMALKAYGIDPTGCGESFFDDRGEVPAAVAEYICYAAKAGIVDGDFTKDGLVFRPSDTVTLEEAAVILSRLIGVGSGEESVYAEGMAVTAWAVPDVCAMLTLGIFDADGEIDGGQALTRGEVAEYLYRMVNVK